MCVKAEKLQQTLICNAVAEASPASTNNPTYINTPLYFTFPSASDQLMSPAEKTLAYHKRERD